MRTNEFLVSTFSVLAQRLSKIFNLVWIWSTKKSSKGLEDVQVGLVRRSGPKVKGIDFTSTLQRNFQ